MAARQSAQGGLAEAVSADDLNLPQAWKAERIGDENPGDMCDVTMYMLHMQALVGRHGGSQNFSTPCQCQGCAGPPGTHCCCQRPQSLHWSCEYLMFESRGWQQAAPMDPIKQSLPWLLTCPLCSLPSGASTTQGCCTTAKSHVEALQEFAMPQNLGHGLAELRFEHNMVMACRWFMASSWSVVALGVASLFAWSCIHRRQRHLAEPQLQSKHDLVVEEGGSLLHT